MRRRYLDLLSFNVGLSFRWLPHLAGIASVVGCTQLQPSRWRGWERASAALRVDVGTCVRLALPYIFIMFYLV